MTSRILVTLLLCVLAIPLYADPCGMVPPIYTGGGPPIARIGEQQTYVFFKDGIETFVIRPGFSGKVEEFGMLIPFPMPPAVRKVPDPVFAHLAAAVDPPEVVVQIYPDELFELGAADDSAAAPLTVTDQVKRNEVRVLRQEAVGMYEVAVLEAGSAEALQKWMDKHSYRYPEGMDSVCEDYVEEGWCFVAVKTAVGTKAGIDPKPGQRKVDTNLPAGSSFDGFVQAMGFRFQTDNLVLPMRLSAFNEGELRNIVYLLTDGPRRIRSIPEEYVVRQISGDQLYRNLTELLPLRIIGGTEKDIQPWQRKSLPGQRDPEPKNGVAKQLFAADLLAVSEKQLILPHEEREKELLAIGEHFEFRGPEIDKLNATVIKKATKKTVDKALSDLKSMTLTVVDGDFPRDVLAGQNLTFAEYRMPRRRNNARSYDANQKGPSGKKEGILKLGALDPPSNPIFTSTSLLPIALSLMVMGFVLFHLAANRKKKIFAANKNTKRMT